MNVDLLNLDSAYCPRPIRRQVLDGQGPLLRNSWRYNVCVCVCVSGSVYVCGCVCVFFFSFFLLFLGGRGLWTCSMTFDTGRVCSKIIACEFIFFTFISI